MPYEIIDLKDNEVATLLATPESQFFDFKRQDNTQKIYKTASAFANTDGGELLIGIADPKEQSRWLGFSKQEDANDIISVLKDMFKEGHEYVTIDFLRNRKSSRLVIRAAIQKTQFVVRTPDGKVFTRQNASDKELKTTEAIIQLHIKL